MYFYKSYRDKSCGRVLYCLEVYCDREIHDISEKAIVHDDYITYGITEEFCTFSWNDDVPFISFHENSCFAPEVIKRFSRNQNVFLPYLDSDINHSLINIVLRHIRQNVTLEQLEKVRKQQDKEVIEFITSLIQEEGFGLIDCEKHFNHLIKCLYYDMFV